MPAWELGSGSSGFKSHLTGSGCSDELELDYFLGSFRGLCELMYLKDPAWCRCTINTGSYLFPLEPSTTQLTGQLC